MLLEGGELEEERRLGPAGRRVRERRLALQVVPPRHGVCSLLRHHEPLRLRAWSVKRVWGAKQVTFTLTFTTLHGSVHHLTPQNYPRKPTSERCRRHPARWRLARWSLRASPTP